MTTYTSSENCATGWLEQLVWISDYNGFISHCESKMVSQYKNEMESAKQRPTENPESGEPAIELYEVMIPETEMQESVNDCKRVEADLKG